MRGQIGWAVTGAAIVLAACDGGNEVIGRGEGAQAQLGESECPAFVPGTNMVGGTWTSDPDRARDAAFFVQHVGDLDHGTALSLGELAAACHAIAIASGAEADPPGATPTVEDVQSVCGTAAQSATAFRAHLGGALTWVPGPRDPCEVEEARAQCLATCTDGDTCDTFCLSATVWMAECPGELSQLVLDPPPGAGDAARLDALEEGYHQISAANDRMNLLVDRIGTVADGEWVVDAACVSVLIESMERSAARLENAHVAQQSVVSAMGG